MATLTPWGPSFPINTATADLERDASIKSFGNGTFIAVWCGGAGSSADIRGQVFNADGSKKGGEFLVNSTTADAQYRPVVTVLNDGRFVVAWEDYSGLEDTSGSGIRGRIFNPDGSAAGPDFQINLTSRDSYQEYPSILALANGGFAVTFEGPDSSGTGVYTRAYDRNGNPVGSDRLANLGTDLYQGKSVSVGLRDGRYLVFFEDSNGNKIVGRLLNPDGAAASNQDFEIGSTGNKGSPSATLLADGRVIVAWKVAGSETGIKAQILNPDGTAAGSEFAVHAPAAGNQDAPKVAALADGGFAVAYRQSASGTPGELIVTTFDKNGQQTGDGIVVQKESQALSVDANVLIETLPDGRLVVSWTETTRTPSGSDSNIRAQILDPRGAGVTLKGSAADDQYHGSRFADALGGAAGKDVLRGEEGDDRLSGGLDNDTLTGGAGRDTFVFDTKLGTYRTDRQVNFDKIADFDVKDDTIWLDNAVFRKLGKGTELKPGKLKKDFFHVGTKAGDPNDYILYDKKTGVMSYDADGSGKGKAVEFGQLDPGLKLTWKNFFVI